MAKKKALISLIIVILIGLGGLTLRASPRDRIFSYQGGNFPYIEENLLASARYTTKEEVDPERYNEYLSDYTLNYNEAELLALNYQKVAENDKLELYFHPVSFSVLVINKITGYQWSSRAEFVEAGEANRAKLNEMESGIFVEYVLGNNVSRRTNMTNIMAEKAKVTYQSINGGLMASVNFDDMGFRFDVKLVLDDDALVAAIDHRSIVEKLPRYRLIGIHLFPYLGSARQDKIPGYFFIPDGVGALVRFRNRNNISYVNRYYGDDYGYASTAAQRQLLSLPLFGIVHDVGSNAMLAIIEDGDLMARLGCYLWGYEGSNYFRMYPRYYFREVFTNVINRSGAGRETITAAIKPIDIKVRYCFLTGADADYVGMAKKYRDYLTAQAILTPLSPSNRDITLNIDFLMAEREKTFIGHRKIEMTHPKDALGIYQTLQNAGITHQTINLLGWSKSGFVDVAPYKVSFAGSGKSYRELKQTVHGDGNKLYLNADYVIGTADSARIDYADDVARQMSKLKMEISRNVMFAPSTKLRLIYPEASYHMAAHDYKQYKAAGDFALSFTNLGNTLFSYYLSPRHYTRSDGLTWYRQIAALYGRSGFYAPNAYLFDYVGDYFNMPLYNSHHHYFTDTVPFLPIVLKGYVNIYSPYLNFNALGKDLLLTLIDYGINPSYIITAAATAKMRYTKANVYYSTCFADFSDKIIVEYQYINDALKHVVGAAVIRRTVLDDGVVAVAYSNGKTIYINYRSTDYHYQEHIIQAKDYAVL